MRLLLNLTVHGPYNEARESFSIRPIQAALNPPSLSPARFDSVRVIMDLKPLSCDVYVHFASISNRERKQRADRQDGIPRCLHSTGAYLKSFKPIKIDLGKKSRRQVSDFVILQTD